MARADRAPTTVRVFRGAPGPRGIAGHLVALSELYRGPVEELTLEDWLSREVELVEEETPLLA